MMMVKIGLVNETNRDLKPLKVLIHCYESGYVLNVAYNMLAGRMRLEDIELRHSRYPLAYAHDA
jgi:hypothetical protein